MTRLWPLLLGLYLVAYAPIWHNGFVFEDHKWISAAGTPLENSHRPLMRASWSLQQHILPAPQAFHALNLALHLLAVGLLGLLARRLGLSELASTLVAAAWLVHPLNVEPVAYLAARPELFAAIGVLGACLLATINRVWCWPLIALCLAFGLAGKESAVVGLALVPLTVWACQDRQSHPALRWSTVLFLTASAAAIGLLATDYTLRDLANMGEAHDMSVTVWQWVPIQATAACRLIALSVYPHGLTVDYDYDAIDPGFRVVACAWLLIFATAAALLAPRHPRIAFGLAWCLISLAPRFVIQTPRGYLNEHQFYTPFLGLMLAAGATWDAWRLSPPSPVWGKAAAWLDTLTEPA